jgi:hypothetical protein
MPPVTARIQHFHIPRPLPLKDLKRIAYQEDSVEGRGMTPFFSPAVMSAQITGEDIYGAILRIPGMHPVDTRWSCTDPDFALLLPTVEDEPYSQEEMKAFDDPEMYGVKIREIPHAPDLLSPKPIQE